MGDAQVGGLLINFPSHIFKLLNARLSAMRLILFCIFAIVLTTESFAQIGKTETGVASYYADKFVFNDTATTEIYTQDKFTAAHKTLPLGTWVRVTNLSNDSVVIVRINDRMPKSNKRSIDLTKAAAKQLNYIAKGLTKVKIEVIPAPDQIFGSRELPTQEIEIYVPAALPFYEQQKKLHPISVKATTPVAPAHKKRWWKRS